MAGVGVRVADRTALRPFSAMISAVISAIRWLAKRLSQPSRTRSPALYSWIQSATERISTRKRAKVTSSLNVPRHPLVP